ncbi:hypothetical protein ACP70R_043023 [Stipagrostis hirtigluma subsp. patula]
MASPRSPHWQAAALAAAFRPAFFSPARASSFVFAGDGLGYGDRVCGLRRRRVNRATDSASAEASMRRPPETDDGAISGRVVVADEVTGGASAWPAPSPSFVCV